jgi:hypothetical protein
MVLLFKHSGGNFEWKYVLYKAKVITVTVRIPVFLADAAQSLSGYWSSGQRLTDSARVAGEGIEPGDLPEYMVRCATIVSRSINDKAYSAAVHKHARDLRLSAVSEEKNNQQVKRPRNAKQGPA